MNRANANKAVHQGWGTRLRNPTHTRSKEAGAFVCAWTDEWFNNGVLVEDWKIGITDRHRRPKPALAAVKQASAQVPLPADQGLPRISVVECTFNGERTLRHCLEGLHRLDYPNHEVIVVNDGSTDGTESIAREYPVRLISTENRSLSSARNTGMEAASGEIIATSAIHLAFQHSHALESSSREPRLPEQTASCA